MSGISMVNSGLTTTGYPNVTTDNGSRSGSRESVQAGNNVGTVAAVSEDSASIGGSASVAATQRVSGANATSQSDLNLAELQTLRELQQTDREVRMHEQAHQSAGGSQAGAMSLTYERGPDGNLYAVGGEVSIDTSEGQSAEETMDRAQTVINAALAPLNPSSQDRRVAAQAQAMLNQARAELLSEPDDSETSLSSETSGAPSDTDDSATVTVSAVGASQETDPTAIDSSTDDSAPAAVLGAVSGANADTDDTTDDAFSFQDINDELRGRIGDTLDQLQTDSENRQSAMQEYQTRMDEVRQRTAEVAERLYGTGAIDDPMQGLVGSMINADV